MSLQETQVDGSTLRQTLESLQRQTNKYFPELDTGEMPKELEYIWVWFLKLNSNRTSNGFGVNPITYQDLWFFFQLENTEPECWEIDLIRAFDSLYMEHTAKQQSKQTKQAQNKKR